MNEPQDHAQTPEPETTLPVTPGPDAGEQPTVVTPPAAEAPQVAASAAEAPQPAPGPQPAAPGPQPAYAQQPPYAPPPGPKQPSGFRKFVGHRATQIVAAGVLGLAIGGGVVGAIVSHDDGSRGGPGSYSRTHNFRGGEQGGFPGGQQGYGPGGFQGGGPGTGSNT
jgi:hypothetical protein